ncbi:hypothetical protein LEP1GSC132_0108 [Leptospira kirschneri str. 200803703]|uniref:Uncharacterized protein n=1 Tax=Leptospira kirschneri str. 200802841 TaxID=1193047 RepID=A0A828Y2S2_9LEPT|nr:hypothetical protein LEP1GSC044_0564 [Leptospira kirschneri serovar Grippotyphosa str. RM52]EKO53851.1 hypothetical protein LEP1GSC131_3058 [Leptospira kirschneri str. 200802841]EMK14149.1 hypothetical protein LEP1GSC042_0367 [Leptospira kirschneri serovar Bim str. PUO 1247]EMN05740.1 hypothetical protein LEP1GSC046_0214 [Leptospira kirschneri serovar Bim str. 1051]EMO65838.1 hypothetical protein LEP1GSC132_0108 [Leptospira kirschneri str. 200803703]EMO74949.1 hypothetical protein LEP1GSC12
MKTKESVLKKLSLNFHFLKQLFLEIKDLIFKKIRHESNPKIRTF